MANMGFPKDGEPNQGWKLYLTSLIMVLCAGLIVIARIATRLRVSRLMVDDYTIMASLVGFTPKKWGTCYHVTLYTDMY